MMDSFVICIEVLLPVTTAAHAAAAQHCVSAFREAFPGGTYYSPGSLSAVVRGWWRNANGRLVDESTCGLVRLEVRVSGQSTTEALDAAAGESLGVVKDIAGRYYKDDAKEKSILVSTHIAICAELLLG